MREPGGLLSYRGPPKSGLSPSAPQTSQQGRGPVASSLNSGTEAKGQVLLPVSRRYFWKGRPWSWEQAQHRDVACAPTLQPQETSPAQPTGTAPFQSRCTTQRPALTGSPQTRCRQASGALSRAQDGRWLALLGLLRHCGWSTDAQAGGPGTGVGRGGSCRGLAGAAALLLARRSRKATECGHGGDSTPHPRPTIPGAQGQGTGGRSSCQALQAGLVRTGSEGEAARSHQAHRPVKPRTHSHAGKGQPWPLLWK